MQIKLKQFSTANVTVNFHHNPIKL